MSLFQFPRAAFSQLSIHWLLGVLFVEVKRPGRGADYSPPCGGEVKYAWRYTSTSIHLNGLHGNNFTFSFSVWQMLPLELYIFFYFTVWKMCCYLVSYAVCSSVICLKGTS